MDYGSATTALAEAVSSAKAGDALAPVTVVVPANHLGVAARRSIASGAHGPVVPHAAGLAATTFLTVARLAELLGATRLAASGRRPVSAPVLGAAVRAELGARPGPFAPVASYPATQASLVAAYRELRACGPGSLAALARAGTRADAVVRLTRAVQRRVSPNHYDEVDLGEAALDAVAEGSSAGLGHFVVHLPQRLTAIEQRLLRSIGERHPMVLIAGTCGDARADEEVRATVSALGPGIGRSAPAGPAPFDPARSPRWPVDVASTRIVSASDAEEEARIAVQTVIDAVRAGAVLGRIAVLHASPAPYARLLVEQLDAAGVARNGASVTPVADLAVARTLLGALELHGSGWRRDDVFAWLASVPVHHGPAPAPIWAWERLSRDAGVVAGLQQWDRRLEALGARHASRSPGVEDLDPATASRAGREAGLARDLRHFVATLADELETWANQPRPWHEHAARARRLLARLTGDDTSRAGWPASERTAADRVELALGRLEALDTVEGPVPLEMVARTLRLELESDLGRTGRLGEGALVGPVGLGLGLELDLVVVVGLAEGTFPALPADDALLPDAERALALGQLPLRSTTRHRQHRQLRAVLAGARRHVLTVPRGDLRRSTQRVPSRWVLDMAGQLHGAPLTAEDLARAPSGDDAAGWLDHAASFAARLATPSEPATGQEARLRALRTAVAEPGTDAAAELIAGSRDSVLRGGAEVIAARAAARFTRFDGLVGPGLVTPLAERALSPSALERWVECPFAFFVHDELGARPVERPEQRHRVSPTDRGSLVHGVLEDFLTEALDRPGGPPEPGDAWTSEDRARMAALADARLDALEAAGRGGRVLYWRRERLAVQRDLARWLTEDDRHRRAHGLVPLAAEVAFGRGQELAAVSLSLDDGSSLHIEGKADRVDRAADGTLVVTDYKTGRIDRYRGISAADPDAGGTRFQLPVYAAATRARAGDPDAAVRAQYLFASSAGDFARIELLVDDDALAKVREHLGVVAQGIASGRFPARPDDTSSSPFVRCAACDPDGLGTAELAAAWRRKRDDPALAGYAALVEPAGPVEAAHTAEGGLSDG